MPAIVPTTKNILVVAGDPSGDLHGSNLIKALKAQDPDINIAALGGKRMQEVSDRFIYNLVAVGAAGFAEPLRRFFLWIRLIGLVRKYLEEKRPACVITVDFYGFNHQVLGLAAHRKIPAFYYISPQVWASRPKRAERIARLVKHVFVTLPFEQAIYKKAGVDCTFVGHPLLDIMPQPAPRAGAAGPKWRIGILPGSRKFEIELMLPVFAKAFNLVKDAFAESEAFVFAAREVPDDLINGIWRKHCPSLEFKIIREDNYAQRSTMDIVMTSSGTATLENTLLGLPLVVAYKLPWFTYLVAKRVITVPYISLTNILAGKPLVKEYIQDAATPEAISGEIMALLQNPQAIAQLRARLLELRKTLGEPGAGAKASAIILSKVFSKHA